MRVVNISSVSSAVAASIALVACGGDQNSVDTLPLPTAAPTVAPASSEVATTVPVNEEYYTIQQGDTLFGIAQSFGITVDDLISYNAIADPDAIQAGQRLKIPPSSGTATTAPATTSTTTMATTTP